MNIWLIDPFDSLPGESLQYSRYGFLAEMLANIGHKVTWWSSNFHHPTKKFRSQGRASIEVNDNLRIILLRTPGYTRNISFKRIWNHYVYAKALRVEGARCTEAPDVILADSTPLLAANAALALAQKFGAKFIVDIQDIWPEAFAVAFPKTLRPLMRIFLSPLKRLADRIYDKADGITAVSHTYLQRALSASRDKAKSAMMLPLGVDLVLFSDCLRQPASDSRYIKHERNEFWAVYSGNIGKNYDIKTILEAAARLSRCYPNIRFFLTGKGPDYGTMTAYVREKKLTNVTFTGLLSYQQFVQMLGQCDAGMNAIVASSEITLSNKFVAYLAAGLPILSSVKGEIEGLTKAEHVGLQYEAGSAESLAKSILELYNNPQERLLMAQKARRLAEERFDMNKVYPKFEEFLQAVVSKRK